MTRREGEQAAVHLATTDFPHGNIEYVGTQRLDRYDIGEVLPIYSEAKLLPDEIYILEQGWAAVRMVLNAGRRKSLVESNEVSVDLSGIGHFHTEDHHTEGHFTEEEGLQLLRGVDQIHVAIIAERIRMQREGIQNPVLDELRGIIFRQSIPPGLDLAIGVSDTQVEGFHMSKMALIDKERRAMAIGARTAAIEIRGGGQSLMAIERSRMIVGEESRREQEAVEKKHNIFIQGIELAAQTLIIVGLHQTGSNAKTKLSLFTGIEYIKLGNIEITPNSSLTAAVVLRAKDDAFIGDALLYFNGALFARVQGISGVFGDADKIKRIINRKMNRLLKIQEEM